MQPVRSLRNAWQREMEQMEEGRPLHPSWPLGVFALTAPTAWAVHVFITPEGHDEMKFRLAETLQNVSLFIAFIAGAATLALCLEHWKRKRSGRSLTATPGYLDGVEAATPEVQNVIRHKARWQKMSSPLPIVVPPDEFVAMEEARRVIRWPDARRLITAGLLQTAYRSTDGEGGITREAFDRELRWRDRSSGADRLRREARLAFGPVLGWWRYPSGT